MKSLLSVYILLTVTVILGWLVNLCHVIWVLVNINPTFGSLTARFVLECVGVFVPPLGALMGWMHLFF